MPLERATRKDWFWPVLFLLLGVGGAFVSSRLYFKAFPEASIELRIPKQEIARRSIGFLRGRGLATEGYHRFTLFDFDEQAKTYLERELGLEEANRQMASQVNIWRWKTRLVKPPQKEEMTVWLTPSGALVGFDHVIEEKRPGAKLNRDEAQRVAEVFLRAERGLDLARYRLVADELATRPSRLDYTFTWEQKDLKLRDATVRMSVTVQGDQVGGFREFLKIPERWIRDYERLRSHNDLLGTIATTSYALLMLAAIVVVIRRVRREREKGRGSGALAIGGVVAALFIVAQWNDFAVQTQSWSTNTTYASMVALYMFVTAISGVFVGLFIAVMAAAGEPLYRQIAPGRVALGHLFTFRGLRSKEFFTSTLVG